MTPKPKDLAFARALRAWRGDKLTQVQAATALGVNRRSYERWESGGSQPCAALRQVILARITPQ